jgi:hypothetical protein
MPPKEATGSAQAEQHGKVSTEILAPKYNAVFMK